MSHPIPKDAQRLADRLRTLADEVESAARYGIPVPAIFSIHDHELGSASFSASATEFDAWADYTEAQVEEYDHHGHHWSRATTDLNGLPLTFATRHTEVTA